MFCNTASAMFWSIIIGCTGLYLSRGNHESKSMNKIYGFEGEVSSKFNDTMVKLFAETFCYLPLANVLNKKVFVVHGGLFSSDGVKLSDISAIDRFREPPDEGTCMFVVALILVSCEALGVESRSCVWHAGCYSLSSLVIIFDSMIISLVDNTWCVGAGLDLELRPRPIWCTFL